MRFSVSETGSCSENEMVLPCGKTTASRCCHNRKKADFVRFAFKIGRNFLYSCSERKKGGFFLKKRRVNTLETLVCLAILTALQVVLSRFLSVQMWNMKYGFSFVPVMLAANLYGPLGAAAVYGIGDIIGSLVFPTGTYFPGFTLTAVVTGVVWGLLLKGKIKPVKAVFAVLTVQGGCSFLLNSYWISFISGVPYASQLAVRWPQSLGYAVIHLAFIFLLLERLSTLIKKIMKQN